MTTFCDVPGVETLDLLIQGLAQRSQKTAASTARTPAILIRRLDFMISSVRTNSGERGALQLPVFQPWGLPSTFEEDYQVSGENSQAPLLRTTYSCSHFFAAAISSKTS